jgi:hypothetical protein
MAPVMPLPLHGTGDAVTMPVPEFQVLYYSDAGPVIWYRYLVLLSFLGKRVFFVLPFICFRVSGAGLFPVFGMWALPLPCRVLLLGGGEDGWIT